MFIHLEINIFVNKIMSGTDRRLLIKQYKLARKTIKENLKEGSNSVPFVDDTILYGIPDFRGVYTKGFIGHTGPNGEVRRPDKASYELFISGLKTKDLDKINSVCSVSTRLADPFCLFDLEVEGKYRESYRIPLAPSITSLQGSAELLEVYTMALLRDFELGLLDPSGSKYANYSTIQKNTIQKYIDILNNEGITTHLKCPVDSTGKITPGLLFRGKSNGDKIGPYLSQFLYYPAYLGNFRALQQFMLIDASLNKIDLSTNNFGLNESYVRDLLEGVGKTSNLKFKIGYIQTIRDVAIYINRDEIWQAFFNAAVILLDAGVSPGFFSEIRKVPRGRFINLGVVDLYNLMMKAIKLAMNAAWVWKWHQLKQRPEEMANQVNLTKKYPTDPSAVPFPSLLLNSQILTDISNNNNGKYLMPLAYSQGSPYHPSYPGGHATIAGAATTILKAWFNCDSGIQAFISDPSGTDLDIYYQGTGSTAFVFLKIGDELDKLATNCSHSRNFAGIHYLSDSEGGILLGEQVAIDLLKDEVYKYKDKTCFRLRRRDGTVVEIKNHNENVSYIPGTIYSYSPNPKAIFPVPIDYELFPPSTIPNNGTNTPGSTTQNQINNTTGTSQASAIQSAPTVQVVPAKPKNDSPCNIL
jgi:membrane-associated phospholipid phosphatase